MYAAKHRDNQAPTTILTTRQRLDYLLTRLRRSGNKKTIDPRATEFCTVSSRYPANRLIGKAPPAPSNRRFACGKTGGAFVATSGSLVLFQPVTYGIEIQSLVRIHTKSQGNDRINYEVSAEDD